MYRYRHRPAYGSKKLLIELIPKNADKAFMDALLSRLKELELKIESVEDLWMNDEVILKCESKDGKFLISKDVWDLVFIMDAENPNVINEIDRILNESDLFRKEIVDYSDYELPKKGSIQSELDNA